MKVTEILRNKIKKFPKGFIFTYDEFGIDAENESAFKKAVSRLVKSGAIERLSKGRFYKPKKGIINNLRPDEYEIVKDLLFENQNPIGYITGLGIFNRLGLTTQMSNIIQIGANFDKKQLQRGKYTIKFIRQRNTITQDNIYFLQLLDSIRFIKNIPDSTVNQSYDRLVFLIGELPLNEINTFTNLALKYPPSVRSLTGAILEKLGYNNRSDRLLNSLRATTNFNIEISDKQVKEKQKWKIQ